MGTARLPLLKALVLAVGVFGPDPAKGAPMELDLTFASTNEVRAWAAKQYFGGSSVRVYTQGGKELCVVNGTPTSGILTSQIVVFGRAKPEAGYRVLLATGWFQADVKDKEDARGVAFYEREKLLFLIPFDIVTAGESRLRPRPPKK